jgi:hypothetical protein
MFFCATLNVFNIKDKNVMARWRAEALERLPELRKAIDSADEIMALWIDIVLAAGARGPTQRNWNAQRWSKTGDHAHRPANYLCFGVYLALGILHLWMAGAERVAGVVSWAVVFRGFVHHLYWRCDRVRALAAKAGAGIPGDCPNAEEGQMIADDRWFALTV